MCQKLKGPKFTLNMDQITLVFTVGLMESLIAFKCYPSDTGMTDTLMRC